MLLCVSGKIKSALMPENTVDIMLNAWLNFRHEGGKPKEIGEGSRKELRADPGINTKWC